jgi:ribosome-associated toxin RatA of RatAB toxin-antitoxin module
MTRIDRSLLLPYFAEQVFSLVNDVESYPQYMDGCVGAEILLREPDLLEARLDLAKGGITQSFATRNRMVSGQSIVLELIEGPFDHFAGRWDFTSLGDAACKVSLVLEFNVSNGLLGVAATRLFDKVTNNLVDSVGRRAKQVYG